MRLKTKYTKDYVITDMIIELLLHKRKMPISFMLDKYEISKVTFYKYVSTIRCLLVEFNYYEYDLSCVDGVYFIKCP